MTKYPWAGKGEDLKGPAESESISVHVFTQHLRLTELEGLRREIYDKELSTESKKCAKSARTTVGMELQGGPKYLKGNTPTPRPATS